MKKNLSNLLIIGSNARIVPLILNNLNSVELNYYKIHLVYHSERQMKISDPKLLYYHVSVDNIAKFTFELINNSNEQFNILITNFPSKEYFNKLYCIKILESYKNIFNKIKNFKNIKKVVFLGSVAGVYPNFLHNKYNHLRTVELKKFFEIWNSSNFQSGMCILPPLETSKSIIGKYFFSEKRSLWSLKIINFLENSYKFEYPDRFHSWLIIKLFIFLNLNKVWYINE